MSSQWGLQRSTTFFLSNIELNEKLKNNTVPFDISKNINFRNTSNHKPMFNHFWFY